MGTKGLKWLRILGVVGLLIASSICSAQAQDPCSGNARRALVLSGGGPKGAFETGAIYHLIVHRNCDFHEFSGTSVGALNSAFLAQAAESSDAAQSHANLVAQTEDLVSLWQSVKGPRDIMKARPLATMRFGLFGLENLYDFTPMRQLLDKKITAEKLAKGRPVRAGVVSFWDGGYREVLARESSSPRIGERFLEYMYASATPPLYGKMPRIVDGAASDDERVWPQFADGSLRHITPVVSYFKVCQMPRADAGDTKPAGADRWANCRSNYGFMAPPHAPLQQLFVIVTSPYSRESDLLPADSPSCCEPGRHQLTDGRKILSRTMELLDDASYRWDLDYLLLANDMLRWRSQAYFEFVPSSSAPPLPEARRQILGAGGFAMESYNFDPLDPAAPSLPYEVGLIAPEKEYAAVSQLFNALTPVVMQEQLYCGCTAADLMMQREFGLASMVDKCASRFPPLAPKGAKPADSQPGVWQPDVCRKSVK